MTDDYNQIYGEKDLIEQYKRGKQDERKRILEDLQSLKEDLQVIFSLYKSGHINNSDFEDVIKEIEALKKEERENENNETINGKRTKIK